MDLIYFLICYTATLATVKGYVLLAANLDDFRTIAKKFVPDNLAEQIVEIASETGQTLNKDDDTGEYEDSQLSQQEETYEITTQGYKQVIAQQQAPAAGVNLKSAPPVITLDDLVEKVKQRLQVELLNRSAQQALAAQQANAQSLSIPNPNARPINRMPNKNLQLTGANDAIQSPVYGYKNPVNVPVAPVAVKEVQYETVYEDPPEKQYMPKALPLQYQGQLLQSAPQPLIQSQQPQMIQSQAQPQIIPKKLQQQRPNQNKFLINPQQAGVVKKVRYVRPLVSPQQNNQIVKIQPSISVMQQPRQINRIPIKQKIQNKQLIRATPQTVLQTPATEKVQEPPVGGGGIFEAVDMRKSNDSYEDYVTPAKEEAFESDVAEETVPFVPVVITLKTKPTIKLPPTTTDMTFEPQAEDTTGAQVQANEYDDETTDATTEPKAKTETISFEEKETTADLNATTLGEVKGKVTKKSKMGTMIPTREFYKISSPNYYAKLPTVAEQYNFNEPIPEADREPENLKPIGNPPASINGKVSLS